MTDRETFLATVRHALRDGIPPNQLRPLPDTHNDPIVYTPDLSEPVAAFKASAEAAGVEFAGGPHESIEDVVRHVLGDIAPGVVAVSGDPECLGLAVILAGAGVEIAKPGDVAAIARADLGITGAVAGIALTGSLVVDSRRAQGRLASLLPKVHLALLRIDQIVPTPGDVLRNMNEFYPDVLPSNLVMITGPSRSADIELEITEGVHGPQRLLVALRA